MPQLELSPEVQAVRDQARQADQLRVSMAFELYINLMAKVDPLRTTNKDVVIDQNVKFAFKAVEAFVTEVEG